MDVMDREQTIGFLHQHVKTEMLMKHLLTVEASMRGYARKHGEDEDRWGIAGLLHDFDWEICPTPEDHPTFGSKIFAAAGLSRGYHSCGADPRRTHGHPPRVVNGAHTFRGG